MKFLTILVVLIFMVSCKSENERIEERNNLIDSTILNFQARLLQTSLDSIISRNDFNGSVTVLRDSVILYERVNGFADFKNEKPLGNNTVFAVASISKQFTAALILRLQEQGKLSLSDKVSQYLPSFEKNRFEDITILQLLNHTSGLNDYAESLAFDSGSDFKYSNKGYNYLGEIVAKVSSKSLEENLSELFHSAGMTQTFTPENLKTMDFASANVSYGGNASAVANMPMRLTQNQIGTAAGGILSGKEDLSKWNQALYSGKILDSASMQHFKKHYTVREHFALGNVGYGLGIMMNESLPEAYFHTGYVKGAPSLMIYYPQSKLSVIILSNYANELAGKEAIFAPHQRIKEIIDLSELTANQLRNEMMISLPE